MITAIRSGAVLVAVALCAMNVEAAHYRDAEIDMCNLSPPAYCAPPYSCTEGLAELYGLPFTASCSGRPPPIESRYRSMRNSLTSLRGASPVLSFPGGSFIVNATRVRCESGVTVADAVSRFRDESPWATVAQTPMLIADYPNRAKVTGLVVVSRRTEAFDDATCTFAGSSYQPASSGEDVQTWRVANREDSRKWQQAESACKKTFIGDIGSPSTFPANSVRQSRHHEHKLRLSIWSSYDGFAWSMVGSKPCPLGLDDGQVQYCGVEAAVPQGVAVKLTMELERTSQGGPGGVHNWWIDIVRMPWLEVEECHPDLLNPSGCA